MWTAAEAVGPSEALIYAIWAFLGIVVTTLGTITVQALKSRAERNSTTASPPAPAAGGDVTRHAERIAVVEHRADDNDDRDDMQDRTLRALDDRVELLERYHDHRDPNWRNH